MMSSATSTEARAPLAWGPRLAVPLLVVLGMPVVLGLYHWRVTTSAVFLWFAWAALIVTAKMLWSAFWAVASDGDEGGEDQAAIDDSLRGDLLREKKSLLRTIKDIEFDRDLGKMSEAEAGQILRVYRARAIEIIKQLESDMLDDALLSPGAAIERELAARLAGEARPQAERTEAEAAAYAAQMEALDELERRDVHIFRIVGGAFLAAVGLFITLATYEAAAGGGMYVLWYGPIAAGIALGIRGIVGLSKVRDRAPMENKAAGQGP